MGASDDPDQGCREQASARAARAGWQSRAGNHLNAGGRGASGRVIRSVLGGLAVLAAFGAFALPADAAEQIVSGKYFVVKDPAPGLDAAMRSVVVFGKEYTSNDTIVGDPVLKGATLEIIANGATSTAQRFTLPAGAALNGSAGWSTLDSPILGYSYDDPLGTNGPVRGALIEKVGQVFMVRVVIDGALGPGPQPHLEVVPPAPGSDGGMRFTINGGDTYCLAFGGSAGGLVENGPSGGVPDQVFKIARSDLLPTATQPACPVAKPLPNIVVVLTDDQRFDTVGTTHSLDGTTPVMPLVTETLADQGVTFTNMYATTPVCTPSRTSILTGLYAHHTGVHTNYIIPNALQTNALPTWLHAHGYRTGFFGKYPQVEDVVPAPPGWDEWQAFKVIASFNYTLTNNGSPVSYGSAASDYATDVLAEKTAQFIQSTPIDQPIFCILATYAPHAEGDGFPVPAPRHLGMFKSVAPWRPPSYSELDLSDKPAWMDALPLASETVADFFTYGSWSDLFRQYQLEALQAVDDAVENIVAAIEARGQSRDTAIIYTSDNGLLWGEHRLYDTKGPPYAESVRVPLIIRYPRLTAGHQTANQIALNIDLAATIADMVGVRPPYALDGVSLVPILMDPVGASSRPDFLYESPVPTAYDSVGVRTDDEWEYNAYATGEEELYDLPQDPYELHSVASDPANRSLKSTLAARVKQLQQ
jgi:arylsulfatase A-like enzyme